MRRAVNAVAFLVVAISGCATPGPAQVSPGVYMISRTSAAGSVFANMAKLKAEVIEDANRFAASKGKVAVPVNIREERPVPGFPLVEYQFRLVDESDSTAAGKTLELPPDHVTQNTDNINIKIDQAEKKDTYSELLKLEDLRKRGILTDEEFETEKRKLLGR